MMRVLFRETEPVSFLPQIRPKWRYFVEKALPRLHTTSKKKYFGNNERSLSFQSYQSAGKECE